MMKTRKREIAKVGIFGSIDNPTIVTEKELKEIVETFPDIKKAPIKLGGHWTEDRPRLGNVISVSYDDETQILNAEIEEHDVLANAVETGFYPDVSIGAKQRATDSKMYLHHLAYLGDEPPAIKDLENSITDPLDKAEQAIAASDTLDIRYFPSTTEKILYLSDEPFLKNINKDTATGGTIPPNVSPENSQSKEASMTEEEIKKMQDENARLKAENEANEKLLSDSFKKQKDAEKASLRKAMEGKFPVSEIEKVIALSDSFDVGKTIELSDGDSKRTLSPFGVLSEVFGKLPLPVEPGALNLSDGSTPTVREEIDFNKI